MTEPLNAIKPEIALITTKHFHTDHPRRVAILLGTLFLSYGLAFLTTATHIHLLFAIARVSALLTILCMLALPVMALKRCSCNGYHRKISEAGPYRGTMSWRQFFIFAAILSFPFLALFDSLRALVVVVLSIVSILIGMAAIYSGISDKPIFDSKTKSDGS